MTVDFKYRYLKTRFINEVLKQNPKLIIALDYSGAIEQLNKNLLRKDILLIQADALNNPIKDNQIDFFI